MKMSLMVDITMSRSREERTMLDYLFGGRGGWEVEERKKRRRTRVQSDTTELRVDFFPFFFSL